MIHKFPLAWMLIATTLPAWAQTPGLNPGQNVQDAPGQKTPPAAEYPVVPQNVPQTQPNRTTIDTRHIRSMAAQPATPDAQSPTVRSAESTSTRPDAESPHFPSMRVLSFIGPYRQSTLAPLPAGTTGRAKTSLREGRLYLSLHDAIALSIENTRLHYRRRTAALDNLPGRRPTQPSFAQPHRAGRLSTRCNSTSTSGKSPPQNGK
jgi:hypothetical protein